MTLSVKKLPKFRTRIYNLVPGKKPWQRVGVPVMDVVIYLPNDRTYKAMQPRIVSYKKAHNREAAFRFFGAQINPSAQELKLLCQRLIVSKNNLVKLIIKLTKNA